MFNFKITKKYAQEFDSKCAKADAHGFLRFLTQPYFNNESLLDLIAQVEETITCGTAKHDRNMKLNEQIILDYMNEFFSIYMPQKAEEVKQILNKTHPYFIDKNGGAHVNFIHVKKGDTRSSNVGHFGRRSFLEFNVYLHNSIDDLRTTAHELCHALSSHHQHLIELLRTNASLEEVEKFTQKSFERDGIGEIESLIVEKLFNKFLVDKGLYTKEDLANYEKAQQIFLLNEINLIREERDVIKELSCPVSYESLDNLVKNLKNNNQNRLIERVKKMHDDDKYSSYMFRYVVGRIVADQWFKDFEKTLDYRIQDEKLNKFQAYLDKTHKLDLDSACEDLLGKDFECTVKDYIASKTSENLRKKEARAL